MEQHNNLQKLALYGCIYNENLMIHEYWHYIRNIPNETAKMRECWLYWIYIGKIFQPILAKIEHLEIRGIFNANVYNTNIRFLQGEF